MIAIEERPDATPICPYCQASLDTVWVRSMRARLGKRYLYMCPHCRKVLGVSHRKGFWMG